MADDQEFVYDLEYDDEGVLASQQVNYGDSKCVYDSQNQCLVDEDNLTTRTGEPSKQKNGKSLCITPRLCLN